MNASSPAPSPLSPREAELARAEAELSQQEARLTEQLSRAATEAETLARRLDELRQEVSRLPAERRGDEHAREASTRLESAAGSTETMEETRERALAVRHAALEVRRRASQEAQEALEALRQLTTRSRQDLAEVELGLKRSAEAAARVQREREAAQARDAARARQESERVASDAQGNITLPDPRPLGARATRVRMQAQVDLRSDSNFFTGFSTNVSQGGIFVATVQKLPRGTLVDLDVTLPGGRPLKLSGVVRWTREVNDKTPELMPGLGVQFTELPSHVAAAISDFVVTREPLFFPD
jgi:uncharacterized protein (TIGR02266 family)